MFIPRLLLNHHGHVELVRVVLLAEGKIACDNLVQSEYGRLDVVAVLVVAIDVPPVGLVPFPAELGAQVEVKDLQLVGLGVDQ